MRNPSKKRRISQAIGVGLVNLLVGQAHAAKATLEEVVVTAQKQEENIQSVPLAISAITGEEMQKRGINNYTGILQATPSISFSPFPSTSNMLIVYMRGQGEASPASINSEGAVGFYMDGFVIARPQVATFELADVERVEILRGPQGTLYGRNTTGGSINIISRQPSGNFGFRQKLTFGTRDLFRSVTTIDLPEVADVSTKVSLLKSSIDGYVRNTGSGQDFGVQQQQAGRFALRWVPLTSFTVDYFMDKGDVDSTQAYYMNPAFKGRVITVGGVPYIYPNSDGPVTRTFRPFDLNLSTANYEGHGLTLSWDASDTMTIKSLTGYRKLKTELFTEYGDAFGSSRSMGNSLQRSEQLSQEFQFIGSLPGINVDYVGGLYYFKESGSNPYGLTTYPDLNVTTNSMLKADSKSRAAFGQLTWTPPILDDRLAFTAGARFTRDERNAARFFTNNGVFRENGEATGDLNRLSYSRFNPSFTANFQWSADISTYAKVATGYKAGGSYQGAPAGSFNVTFGPEDLVNYELGLKSYWFDHQLRANIALFESKYDDMQLVIPVDPAVLSSNLIYNAGKATIKGAEVELLYAPTDDLQFGLNYAYLDASIDKVDVIPGSIFDKSANTLSPYSRGDNIKDIFVVPHAPRHSFDLSAEHTFLHWEGGNLAAHMDYRWQGEAYQNAVGGKAIIGRQYDKQRAYGLLNGRLTMKFDLERGDSAEISLWGKNLAHKEYYQQVIPQGGVAVPVRSPTTGQVRAAGYTSRAVAWSEPTSFGIDVQYKY